MTGIVMAKFLEHLVWVKLVVGDSGVQIVFLCFVVALLGGGVGYRYGKKKLDNLSQENEKLKAEQHLLRIQMNPHFIYNSLSSIQDLVFNEKRITAVTNIALFAKLIRRMMAYSLLDNIPLSEEIETLHLYLKLESLRFEDQFHYTISTGKGVDPAKHWIPPVLIQPYVENAIRHGLMNKEPVGGEVSIRFDQHNDGLLCVIEDNGIGRKLAGKRQADRTASHQSYSARSINDRIALLKREYGTSVQATIFDLFSDSGQPSGTRVEVRISSTQD